MIESQRFLAPPVRLSQSACRRAGSSDVRRGRGPAGDTRTRLHAISLSRPPAGRSYYQTRSNPAPTSQSPTQPSSAFSARHVMGVARAATAAESRSTHRQHPAGAHHSLAQSEVTPPPARPPGWRVAGCVPVCLAFYCWRKRRCVVFAPPHRTGRPTTVRSMTCWNHRRRGRRR